MEYSFFRVLTFGNHLTEQAERDKLHADDDQNQSDDEERTIAERSSAEHPLDREVCIKNESGKRRKDSPDTKEMERTRHVARCKQHGEQIESAFKESAPRRILIFRICVHGVAPALHRYGIPASAPTQGI